MIKYISCLPLLVSLLFTNSAIAQTLPADKTRVTLVIEPAFNDRPLILANERYVNEHGDTLTIDLFKFYIGNLKLSLSRGYTTYPYIYLVDADSVRSRSVMLDNVPEGSYVSLTFTAGVDSAYNTSGANYGDLDPAKGMYWAWNTGYIMAKLEGRSKKSTALHHAFEYHIGGYKAPFDAARQVTLTFSQPVNIQQGKHTIIRIKANAAAWFANIDLAKVNSIVIPGKEASMMADNYAKMFSVISVKSE